MTDRRSRWLLVAVLGCQFALFRSFVSREIAWAPPYYFDQVTYLVQTYGLHDCLLGSDDLSCLKNALVGTNARSSANGVLLPVQAAVLSFFTGASRFTALSVVFAYYALWQIATFALVRRLSGSLGKAWLALGLLLTLGSPFLPIGGLTDFRLDFAAMALLGIHIALVLASGTFASRRLSIAAAGVAGLLVLVRYLTAAYVAGIWLVTAAACAWMVMRRASSTGEVEAARARLVNLGLAVVTALLVTGPSIWASRQAIYYYYLDPSIDHRIWGGTGGGWADGWIVYAGLILQHHLGSFFCIAAAVALGFGFLSRSPEPIVPEERPGEQRLAWIFLTASVVLPFAILGLYSATSSAAAGVVVPGLVGLLNHATGVHSARSGGWQIARHAAIAVVCVLGLVNQVRGYGRRSEVSGHRVAALEAVAMYDEIGSHCERMRWRRPRISTNHVSDELAAAGTVLTPIYYERHGVFLGVDARLGGSVLGVTPAAALAALADTDVVLLAAATSQPRELFPFEKDMARQRSDVDALVKRRFAFLRRYMFGSQPIDVYVRPDVRVDGTSGEWVTDAGLTLFLSGAAPGATVVLRGTYPLELLGPELDASAAVVDPSGRETPLVADLRIAQNSYDLRIALPGGSSPVGEEAQVMVSFSRSFSPANGDPRRLVVGAPTEARLERP